jgi:hypothetical protein
MAGRGGRAGNTVGARGLKQATDLGDHVACELGVELLDVRVAVIVERVLQPPGPVARYMMFGVARRWPTPRAGRARSRGR